MNNAVMLISFYNPKSLGLRYIENALLRAGYDVTVVFFKNFNSVSPKRATDEELRLICSLIEQKSPMLIGFSVMTSLYLETVEKLSGAIRSKFKIPMVWGGVYATMFPEKCLKHADYVVRGEGEAPITELVEILRNNAPDSALSNVYNLAYHSGEKIVTNEIRDLMTELDAYGIPDIGGTNKYFIENDTIKNIDPQINALSYELSASRGCPFACSYCCAINLHRMSMGKGTYVRFRDVNTVMDELLSAKSKIKNLKVIHFWDEIFCDNEEWINTFVERYKKEINLPFEIWGHPLKTNEKIINKLKKAGLYKVVMGIQSGSPYIRKEIFNRPEKQDDIINASKVLSKCKTPQVIYDFMLRHPFETHETLMETFELCMKLEPPFELQLHGLNFLPGTDIVQKALDMKLVKPEEMEKYMYASIEEQYDMYWSYENNDEKLNYIYNLIYLTQFKGMRKKCRLLAENIGSAASRKKVDKLCKRGRSLERFRYLYKKGIIVFKGTLNR